MTADNGGPAFPVQEVFDERRGEMTQYGSAGISVRDYFAAKAIEGCCAGQIDSSADGKDYTAKHAYAMADAMLKARAL